MKITTSIKISLVAILAGLIIAANANPNPNLKDSQRFRFSKFAFIILTFHFQKAFKLIKFRKGITLKTTI